MNGIIDVCWLVIDDILVIVDADVVNVDDGNGDDDADDGDDEYDGDADGGCDYGGDSPRTNRQPSIINPQATIHNHYS